MRKNKTSLGISTLSTSHLQMDKDDDDIFAMEKQSRNMDDNVLAKKNSLLKK